MPELSAFEAIDQLRAAWRFKPDPVPDDAIERLLRAATRAASGGNAQPWRFVVVRDATLRREIGALYWKAWNVYRPAVERAFGALTGQGASMVTAAEHLARTFADVPVHLIVGMKQPPADFALRDEAGRVIDAGSAYSSIYPAVQNLMLAATALGLATRLITLHRIVEAELKKLLGIPEDVETVALLPIGYPEGSFRPRPRRPLNQVTHWDRWGSGRK